MNMSRQHLPNCASLDNPDITNFSLDDHEIERAASESQPFKIFDTNQELLIEYLKIPIQHSPGVEEEEKINVNVADSINENLNFERESMKLNTLRKPLWELKPSCGICLEKILNDRTTTECIHSFHKNCLIDFIEYMQINEPYREIVCPCCRRAIDFPKLFFLYPEIKEFEPQISSENLFTSSVEQLSGSNFEIFAEPLSHENQRSDLTRTPANSTRQPLLPITMEVTPLATHLSQRLLANASTHIKNRNRFLNNSLENSIDSQHSGRFNIFDLSSSPVNNLVNRNVKLHLSFSSVNNNSGILLSLSQEFHSKQPYLPDRLSVLAKSIELEVKSLSLDRSLGMSNTFWATVSRTFLSDGHATNALVPNLIMNPIKKEQKQKLLQPDIESMDSKYSQKENIAPMLRGIKKNDQADRCQASHELELIVSLGSNYVIPDSEGTITFPILFNLHVPESVTVSYCSNDIVIILGLTKNSQHGAKLIESVLSVMNKVDRLAIIALNTDFREPEGNLTSLIMDFTKNASAGVTTVAKSLVELFKFGDKLATDNALVEVQQLLSERKYSSDVTEVIIFVEEAEEELIKFQDLWKSLDSQKDHIWLIGSDFSNPTVIQKLWRQNLKTLWLFKSFEELTMVCSKCFEVIQYELKMPFHSGELHFLNKNNTLFELRDTDDTSVEDKIYFKSSSTIDATSKVLVGTMAKNSYSTYCQKIFESYFTSRCSQTQDPSEKLKILKLKGPGYLQAHKSFQTLKVEIFHPQVSKNPPKLRRDPKVYTVYAKQICLYLLELLLLEQESHRTLEAFELSLANLSEIPVAKMTPSELEDQSNLTELLSLVKTPILAKATILNNLTLLRNNLKLA